LSSPAGLEKCTHPRDRSRARVAPSPQVENKTRVANSLAAETSWSDVAPAYEFLYFSKQMHLVVLRI